MASSFQVHHILPVELFNSSIQKQLNIILESDTSQVSEKTFKNTALQSFNNRIALYSDADRAEMAKALQDSGHPISDNPIGATQHYTQHPDYNKAIIKWVESIVNSSLNDSQKKIAIIDLQATLRDGLATGEIVLHGDNAKQSINDYLNQHTITLEQLSNPDSERYKQAETRLEIHVENDIKYAKVANENVTVTDGKTSAGNVEFTKTAIAEAIEIIKTQSYDSIPLTDLMKNNLEKLVNGGDGLSEAAKKQIIENFNHAKAYVNGITDKPPSGIYQKLVNSSADLVQNQQKTNQLTESLKNSAFSDSEKSNIQSEISRLQGEKLIIDAEIVKIQGTKESLNVNAGKFGQGGAIEIQVFGDALNKSMQVVNGTIETIRQDTQQIIKNNMLNVVDGQIKLNPEMSNNLGKYLSESLMGGKVGAGVMAADFLNNTFEGLVVGLETGDWQPFQEQAIEYGPQALVGTVLFAAGAELIPVVAGLLGVPVLGEVVLGGLLVYGAYQGGKAVGELLHKIYDHIVDHGIPVPFGLDKLFDPNNISKWMDDVTPDFIKDWLGLNREGHHYYYDPLILDLDGDGIETIAHNKLNGALFDNDADGLKTATGWVSPHDGLLVFDRNADGIINDGTEVFGDNTYLKNGEKAEHGFDALADLDTDKNGKIDANDEDFTKLKVWRDLNQDGKSQENELFSLTDLGIKSLNVAYNNTNTTLAGNNILVQVSSYEKTDGSTFKMGDVNFSFDSIYSEFTNRIEVSKEIKDLPELKGYGRVRDLHEAMSLSSDLEQLVRQYELAQTSEEQKSLLPELLKAWAKTDPSYHEYTESLWASMVSPSGQGVAVAGGNKGTISFDQVDPAVQAAFSNAKSKIGVIDSFLGTKTEKLFYIAEKDILKITESINNIYSNITFSIYKGLYGQTEVYKNYADKIEKEWFLNDDGDIGFILNFKNVEQVFESKFSLDTKNTFFELVEFTDHIVNIYKDVPKKSFEDLQILLHKNYENFDDATLLEINSFLTQYSPTLNYITGTNGADILNGTAKAEIFLGGKGNDILNGGIGQDTLIGGSGNDVMTGGDYEKDIYIFQSGHGQDIINDKSYDWTSLQYFNDVKFEGANFADAQFLRVGNDLVIKAFGTDDSVTFKNYLDQNDSYSRDFNFIFADKTISTSEITGITMQLNGTDGNDVLNGWKGKDILIGGLGDDTLTGYTGDDLLDGGEGKNVLNGGDGNDTLITGSGNDVLNGDNGNDTLNGGAGNDTLNGGAGQDTLIGGSGNDVMTGGDYEKDIYIFQSGHGQDIINDKSYDWTSLQYFNDVKFEGANFADAQFLRVGNDLVIKAFGTDDSVTFKNYLDQNDSYSRDFNFIFADKTISTSEIMGLTIQLNGTDGNDVLNGWKGKDNLVGGLGDDTLNGVAGDDQLEGGAGNDILNGGEGSDLLNGDAGNDTLNGDNGNDTLNGGAGNDTLNGGIGQDTLIGGSGNDVMTGGDYEKDIYIFQSGHGQDIINDKSYDWTSLQYFNDVKFEGANFADAQFLRVGNDLVIKAFGTDDSVTFKNYLDQNDSYSRDFNFIFADKTISTSEIMGLTIQLNGTDGNDVLNGWKGKDNLVGSLGDDTLNGVAGDDQLEGGAGNDILNGGEGNDLLNGGAGNDTLNSGTGADTGIFKILEGFGNDATGGNGIDTWSDFNVSQGDKINISELIVGHASKENLNQFVSFEKSGSTVTLSLDRDGNDVNYSATKLLILNNQTNVTSLDDLIKADVFIV